MANESRVIDCFGPNLVIESNGPVGLGGAIAYQLYATTDKDRAKWQQALHASGLSTMEASHGLEIQTGKKNKKGDISFIAMAHNGDVCLNANSGWIRIKGKNIVLDATNELLLQGKSIVIGNADKTTATTEILGKKVSINASKEVKIVNSKRITRKSGNIFLKSSAGNVAAGLLGGGAVQAAFIPGNRRAALPPFVPEFTKEMANLSFTAPSGQQFGPMASDIRLKENIVKVGNSPSGINIYEFNYKSAPDTRYHGVLAHEVKKIIPESVYVETDGFLSVYYSMLDVNLKRL
tara:strand:- start:981 stop:1856 length:876 start_codon:yes stop_codon:yes gene_type:complete